MIRFELELTNDEAVAMRRELRKLRETMLPKMTGEQSDNNDSATPVYMVSERLLRQIEIGLAGHRPRRDKAR
jgi:hypothetical protein